MVQTLELRGTNLSPPKSLGRYPKVFGRIAQRLWAVILCTIENQCLYHSRPYFVPQAMIVAVWLVLVGYGGYCRYFFDNELKTMDNGLLVTPKLRTSALSQSINLNEF